MVIVKLGSSEFFKLAMGKVKEYVESRADATDNVKLGMHNIYIVWYSKTLQNHKALLSTTLRDGMYYEVTYNGDANELYLDAYKKWENVVYKL